MSGAPLVPGRVLGARYELVRLIARGGMAEVWEGLDATLRRPVAVKVLQTHLAADVTFVERFRREAVSAARVAHPCVVATYDAGVDAGTAYIVMELVQGQTLRQLLIASAPLEPGLAVGIALQIADALANAHRAGLVHRDIKPANILLCDDGGGGLRVKVTDFGIAKVGAEIGADLTQVGTVLGTPKYLSPEQVEGQVEPDARSDLYSLGVVLFEMLTGVPPFNGMSGMATALAHLRDIPPRVSSLRPEISVGLDSFVGGMLAKSPADRPPSAVAARQALDVVARQGLTSRPAPVEHPPVAAGGSSTPVGTGEMRPPALSGPVGSDAWRRGATSPYVRAPRPGGVQPPGASPPGSSPTGGTRIGGNRVGGNRVGGNRGGGREGGPRDGGLWDGGLRGGDFGDGRARDSRARESRARDVGVGDLGARDDRPWDAGAGEGGIRHAGARPGDAAPRRVGAPEPPRPAFGAAPDLASGPSRTGRPPARGRRRGRIPGLLVAAVVLAAAIVAATLIADHGGAGRGGAGVAAGPATTSPVTVEGATVWMSTTARPPDNPALAGYAVDGKVSTAWQTDIYSGPHAATFGGMYPGEGLALHLSGTRKLTRLDVVSTTRGWAASTYVSASEPPTGSSVSAWGAPTASASDVQGGTHFSLAGRTGRWVLLWLTNLGPSDRVSIAEVTVR
jgi:serine/threonine protein kinase